MRPSRLLALWLMLVVGAHYASAQLKVGQPAPPLAFTQLQQAPPGTKTDWASLRGKVVVLEFWATWCATCIEQIPHLNALVRSVGSDTVQFIAVDDEDPVEAKKLLARIPIDGWLGFDTTKATIDAYGAEVRPRTVVIDREGRVAAILQPEQLTGARLAALAAGQKVRFPADATESMVRQGQKDAARIDQLATSEEGPKPLFDISVRNGDPKGQGNIITPSDEPGAPLKLDAMNVPVQVLVSFMGLRLNRIKLRAFSASVYSLHVSAPGGSLEEFGPAIQLAVASAARMKITRTNNEEDVWLLEATPKAASLLTVGSGKGHVCFYERDTHKLVMERAPLEKLAETLESYLMTPVMNEAGMRGEFDAAFDLSVKDPDAVKAALEQNLGLTLVRARRKVERITLDSLPETGGAEVAK